MPRFFDKLFLCLLLLCLAAPDLYGQITQSIAETGEAEDITLTHDSWDPEWIADITEFTIENEDEELDNLVLLAVQGDEEAVATIGDRILHQELTPEEKGKYIRALVLVSQVGIPSAQEIFHQVVIDYVNEIPIRGATEAFMTLLPVFENIIRNERSSDLLIISAIKATIGVFYMGGRSEAPLNMLYESLGRLKGLLRDSNPDEKRSVELKMEVTPALGLLLLYDDLANFYDIREVFIEVLSDPRVYYLSRARLFEYLRTVVIMKSYGPQRSQMAYDLIKELIPVMEEILSDEMNWSLYDLIAKTLGALEVVARGNNEQAIGVIERQIPQFSKVLSMEEEAVVFAESIVSVLIDACINGNQPAAECLVSFISADAYIDKVKEVSIGRLAEETRNGSSLAASTLRKAYTRIAGVNDERHVPFSEFLWPDEKFPYWALKELLMNRVINSLNPESLLEDNRPLALMIFAEEGEPEISIAKKLLPPIFIEAGCRVLLYEASTDIELCEVAEKATPLNIKADIALIMGHGSSEGGVQLGSLSSNCHELYRLDSSDMEEMRRFGSRLADDAVVVFFACLLGRGREGNKESVPNKFAEAVPHVGMIISADGVIYLFNNPALTVFEFDSEIKLTNASFFFNDPYDGMYIIRLIESAVEEKARMKLTASGRIKSRGNRSATGVLLLQNYPNPFNPETWIPFHLAQDADVSVRIYDVSGRLVRSLSLGHKEAGIYVEKDKAVYWDGKSDAGEEVASGIYFYTIDAGGFSATRKMIVKR